MSGCGGSGSPGTAILVDLFMGFEAAEVAPGTMDFTKGTAPDSVRFTGGTPGSALMLQLYKTGLSAWQVTGVGTVATADLDKPASIVKLYAANQGTGQGVIRVYDESDVLIPSATTTVTVGSMMVAGALKTFIAGDLGVAGISKVTVTTSSGGLGEGTWIDDFSVTYPTP